MKRFSNDTWADDFLSSAIMKDWWNTEICWWKFNLRMWLLTHLRQKRLPGDCNHCLCTLHCYPDLWSSLFNNPGVSKGFLIWLTWVVLWFCVSSLVFNWSVSKTCLILKELECLHKIMNKSRFPEIGGCACRYMYTELLCLIRIYGHYRKINVLYVCTPLADLIS